MRLLEFKLLEYDQAKTLQNFGEKMLAAAKKDSTLPPDTQKELRSPAMSEQNRNNILQFLLQQLEQADPTPNKKYTQAIAKMYGNGQSSMEDILSTLADYLTKFDRMNRRKKIPVPRNDFNRYTSLEDFMDVVDEYYDPAEDDDTAGDAEKGKYKELYRDADLVVLQPLDETAACYYGRGTRWCTASTKGMNYFDNYSKRGPLFIIIPRKPAYPGEKYQWQFESSSFMNEQDRQIGEKGMTELAARYPQLKNILKDYAEKYTMVPLLTDEFINTIKGYRDTAQSQMANFISQYSDRIAGFGLKTLEEYGLALPPEVAQQITASVPEYLGALVDAMAAPGGFWDKVQERVGDERSEDRIETILSTDPKIKKLTDKSTAALMLKDELTGNEASRGTWDWHQDSIKHVTDLLLRDPVFRFIMKQVPKMYNNMLAETGRAV
jgi:hypothetical protein